MINNFKKFLKEEALKEQQVESKVSLKQMFKESLNVNVNVNSNDPETFLEGIPEDISEISSKIESIFSDAEGTMTTSVYDFNAEVYPEEDGNYSTEYNFNLYVGETYTDGQIENLNELISDLLESGIKITQISKNESSISVVDNEESDSKVLSFSFSILK